MATPPILSARNKLMKARVRTEDCTGCGACAGMCPVVFRLDEQVARVHVAEVPATATDLVEALVEVCPVRAIETEF